jgi:hypothetical protein
MTMRMCIAAFAVLVLAGCNVGSGLTNAVGLARADYLAIDLDTGVVMPLEGAPDLTDGSWRTSRMLFKSIDVPAMGLAADSWSIPGETSSLPASGRTFIAVYEVTQAQWVRLGGQRAWRSISPTADPDGDELPVTGLSLDAARSTLSFASLRILGSLAVPSDDLWETACRAGSSDRFPWGGQPLPALAASYAVLGDTAPGRNGPARVGLRQPNTFGLFDMLGNAAELTDGGHLRGAAWSDPLPTARPSARRVIDAASPHRLGGVRPVYRPDGG